MTGTEGVLNCGNCEFAAQADPAMCGTVAMRVLRAMDKIGYETISGTDRPAQIVTDRLEDDVAVRQIVEVECQLKKLGDAGRRLGYGVLSH